MTDQRLRKRMNDKVLASAIGTKAEISATPYVWRDASDIPMRPWLYGYWFLRGTVACIIAPGGAGKSTLVAGTALALATGRPHLGKTVWNGRKKVWLWNLEDDMDELTRSLQAACQQFGINPEDIEGQLFVDSGLEGSTLCTATDGEDGFELNEPAFEALTAELIRRAIDVLFVDPLVSSHQIDENANSKVDRVIKAWARVAKAANCCIVLVHHTSKAGAAEVNAMSSRGAVALINAARTVVVINRLTDAQATTFGIAAEERRRYINVTDDKHNRAPAEMADWLRLESTPLNNGALWHPKGDSVAVAVPWTPPNAFDDVTSDHMAAIQKRIKEGVWWRNQQSATRWAGEPIAEVLGLDLSDKVKGPTFRKRAEKMLKELIASGALIIWQAEDPATGKIRPAVCLGVSTG